MTSLLIRPPPHDSSPPTISDRKIIIFILDDEILPLKLGNDLLVDLANKIPRVSLFDCFIGTLEMEVGGLTELSGDSQVLDEEFVQDPVIVDFWFCPAAYILQLSLLGHSVECLDTWCILDKGYPRCSTRVKVLLPICLLLHNMG